MGCHPSIKQDNRRISHQIKNIHSSFGPCCRYLKWWRGGFFFLFIGVVRKPWIRHFPAKLQVGTLGAKMKFREKKQNEEEEKELFRQGPVFPSLFFFSFLAFHLGKWAQRWKRFKKKRKKEISDSSTANVLTIASRINPVSSYVGQSEALLLMAAYLDQHELCGFYFYFRSIVLFPPFSCWSIDEFK